jgi:FkbM family methyltransferase
MWTPKRVVQGALQAVGYQIQRTNVRNNPAFQLSKTLQRFDIDCVFDVGANVGQFATELRSVGFEGRIVSFEPLSSAHEKLAFTAEQDARWIVHPRCAVGDRDGEVTINIAGNSVSSSLLPILPSHVTAASAAAYIGVEQAPLHRLDSIAGAYLDGASRPFLKIDAQGYEWQVLDGAVTILPRMHGVLCEMSLVPLYEGQKLWMELLSRLEQSGFTLWAIQKGFVDPRDGRSLQIDAAFVRL